MIYILCTLQRILTINLFIIIFFPRYSQDFIILYESTTITVQFMLFLIIYILTKTPSFCSPSCYKCYP